VDFFGVMFFSVYGGIVALFGAGYYHFAWGVGKMERELAEAKVKLAAMEAAEKDAAQKLKRAG
jgi:hypothetical protein